MKSPDIREGPRLFPRPRGSLSGAGWTAYVASTKDRLASQSAAKRDCIPSVAQRVDRAGRRLGCLALASVALSFTPQVTAQTGLAQSDAASPGRPSAMAGFDQPVPSAALAGLRGGMDVVHNDMHLAGATASNTAINVLTGTNAISAGAFSNMSGMPIVIQNSGANVLIQNAVILNLQMH